MPKFPTMREMGYPWSDGVCVVLAGRGHLEALKYVRNHGCQWGMLKIRSVGPDIGKEMRQYFFDGGRKNESVRGLRTHETLQ